MKKKIAIIGAGIAGLTLANLIKKYTDHEFMVYEREESLSLEEGYGIQLATNSIKILNQIGFDKINFNDLPQSFDFSTLQEDEEILNLRKKFIKKLVFTIRIIIYVLIMIFFIE